MDTYNRFHLHLASSPRAVEIASATYRYLFSDRLHPTTEASERRVGCTKGTRTTGQPMAGADDLLLSDELVESAHWRMYRRRK